MARYWDNKEVAGRGTKFCLVIDPEDGTNPLRTYGWSKDEVLEKVAKTVEAGQQVINRQRAASRPAPEVVPAVKPLTSEEQMQATADLSDPSKAPQAVKTLLRGVGVDLDRQRVNEDAARVGKIAEAWEDSNEDFPSDPRNKRLLMDKALLMAGGTLGNITTEILDAAYRELASHRMLFEEEEAEPANEPTNEPAPSNAPNGNPASRTDGLRAATSYRRAALNAPRQPAVNNQPKYTRAEVEALNSKQFREKLENEPGFKDWYDREYSQAAQ